MALPILLVGILLALFLGLKASLTALRLPPIAGYLLLGWLGRGAANGLDLDTSTLAGPIALLGNIGIILLLFHVGLETHFKKLTQYIGRAGVIAACNIFLSGFLGFVTAYAFGLSLAASLYIGTALTATSIAVSTAAWPREKLATKEGSILLGLVTIDDIVAILLMALLFSLFPFGELVEALVWSELGFALLKFAGLVVVCYLFAHFVEPLLVKEVVRYERMPDSMLTVISVGLIIAALAALLGFSFAIGAFFAGIAFSRDPKAVRMDASMQTLLDLFVPFFFFWIGFQASFISLEGAWIFSLVLLIAAVVGKFIGTWIPARFVGLSAAMATLLALTTLPRASIAMYIMERGLESGVVAESAYTALVVISLITCLVTPLLLRKKLHG